MRRLSLVKTVVFIAFLLSGLNAVLAYSGGSGSEDDPYQIATADDLLALAATPADYDKHFILTADIDLGSSGPLTTALIAPDGDNSDCDFEGTAFTGVFDGAGHKINKLVIKTNGAGNDYLGLFGYTTGQITNLRLTNISITAGNSSYWIGGIAGNNCGSIRYCSTTGKIAGGDDFADAGGLAGDNQGSIDNCFSSVGITGGYNPGFIGGLVGWNYDGSIIDCFATGNIMGGNKSEYVGGLVGLNANSPASINGCYSTGKVTVADESECIGGLVGESFGSISNSFSKGTIVGGSDAYRFGGLV